VSLSSIGYGKNPYGHPLGGSPFQKGGTHPYDMVVGFGLGDWAEEVTWGAIPEFYRAEDGTEGVVSEPLRGLIDALKPLLNELLLKWRDFPNLWNANKTPIELLPNLAYNIGLEVDQTKPDLLQRSEVLNAPLMYLTKGTDTGYEILAIFESMTVQIIPLWAEDCEPGSALTEDAPTTFVPKFDDTPADLLQCDLDFDDPYAIWPKPLVSTGLCRTNKLRLIYTPVDDPNSELDADDVARITERLLRLKPLHVEIDRIVFDGLRASSQVWTTPVSADVTATGHWVTSVVGNLDASSQVWVAPLQADTV
jgi:hypothetical protein